MWQDNTGLDKKHLQKRMNCLCHALRFSILFTSLLPIRRLHYFLFTQKFFCHPGITNKLNSSHRPERNSSCFTWNCGC